jgi:hypothetical protein
VVGTFLGISMVSFTSVIRDECSGIIDAGIYLQPCIVSIFEIQVIDSAQLIRINPFLAMFSPSGQASCFLPYVTQTSY